MSVTFLDIGILRQRFAQCRQVGVNADLKLIHFWSVPQGFTPILYQLTSGGDSNIRTMTYFF